MCSLTNVFSYKIICYKCVLALGDAVKCHVLLQNVVRVCYFRVPAHEITGLRQGHWNLELVHDVRHGRRGLVPIIFFLKKKLLGCARVTGILNLYLMSEY